ncbi:MAG: HAD-IB family hydrolase [Panacibacter sp.]
MPILALFDFDGTITNKDSLLHFTGYAKGQVSLYAGLMMLSPLIALNKMSIVSSQFTKNCFLKYFFAKTDKEKFNQLCKSYAATALEKIIRTTAIEKIHWHKQQGHRVMVVSASPENYIRPWCDALGIECIATKLLTTGKFISGRIDGLNCNAEEKKKRIEAIVDLASFADIYGYGDTSGDKAMLAVCTKPFYQYF